MYAGGETIEKAWDHGRIEIGKPDPAFIKNPDFPARLPAMSFDVYPPVENAFIPKAKREQWNKT